MAIGDKAASQGLQVFGSSQARSLGYQNDNVRGDDVAAVMIRTTALETKIKTRDTIYRADAIGGTGRALKDITKRVAIPKATYARAITLSWRATITDHEGATDIHLRRADLTDDLSTVRSNSTNETPSGVYFDNIPANTVYTYYLAADVASGSANGSWTISSTDQYTSLQALVTTIS